MSPIAGQLVNERLDRDGARVVTAYVPPGVPEVIVFAGEGQLITSWPVISKRPTCRPR